MLATKHAQFYEEFHQASSRAEGDLVQHRAMIQALQHELDGLRYQDQQQKNYQQEQEAKIEKLLRALEATNALLSQAGGDSVALRII